MIHTIALAYTWENVYTYDKEFRLHMARFPQRSWAIILQQAWSLRLRDRIHGNSWNGSSSSGGSSHGNMSRARVNEPCRRFKKGKCNFGNNCKYNHKCTYCKKFGHSVLSCRKAVSDRNNGGNTGGHAINHPNVNNIPISKGNGDGPQKTVTEYPTDNKCK